MDAYTFYRTFGKAEAERIACEAGTNLAYFGQIMHGHYRLSSCLAWRLIKASGGLLTLEELCPPPDGLFDKKLSCAPRGKEKAG